MSDFCQYFPLVRSGRLSFCKFSLQSLTSYHLAKTFNFTHVTNWIGLNWDTSGWGEVEHHLTMLIIFANLLSIYFKTKATWSHVERNLAHFCFGEEDLVELNVEVCEERIHCESFAPPQLFLQIYFPFLSLSSWQHIHS